MHPSRSLFFIFVLCLLLSDASSCTPFADVVLSEQRRIVSFQQRGLPRAFTTPFYETFLIDIYNFVENRFKSSDISSICFTATNLTEFFGNVYDGSAIDREVAILETKFSNIPFLSLATSRFAPDHRRIDKASQKYMNTTLEKLSSGDLSGVALLPNTLQVLFDPARGKNLEIYQAHDTHAPKMTAWRLLNMVTGMVITLELAEVPRINSIQLLRHAVAWLSTVFRALQVEGCGLEVPVLFIPFYHDEFHRLMSYRRQKVPQVTEYDVANELGHELTTYCHLDAWGRLEVLRWKEDEFTDVWTIEQTLFNPQFLEKMAARIGFRKFDIQNYPPFGTDLNTMDGWEIESTAREYGSSYDEMDDPYETHSFKETEPATQPPKTIEYDAMTKTAMRPPGTCIQPFYEFFQRPSVSWEEKCCAAICCNSVLMMQVSLSTNDCCQGCNQAFCHVVGTSLETLAMVHLQPYGYDLGGYVPVAL